MDEKVSAAVYSEGDRSQHAYSIRGQDVAPMDFLADGRIA